MRSINHKPGWWALYIVYCMIPVVIYCWYLWKRTKEVSFAVSYSASHPQAPPTAYPHPRSMMIIRCRIYASAKCSNLSYSSRIVGNHCSKNSTNHRRQAMALGDICIGWRFANHIIYLFPLHQQGKLICTHHALINVVALTKKMPIKILNCQCAYIGQATRF